MYIFKQKLPFSLDHRTVLSIEDNLTGKITYTRNVTGAVDEKVGPKCLPFLL